MKTKSTTKRAKNIIRSEMLSYYSPKDYGVRTKIEAISMDANAVKHPRYAPTDYHALRKNVEGGNFAISTFDQSNLVRKVYGKETAIKLDNQGKTLDVYSHLLAREYAEMKRKNQKGLLR